VLSAGVVAELLLIDIAGGNFKIGFFYRLVRVKHRNNNMMRNVTKKMIDHLEMLTY
jgi:hypothetical protein